MSSSQAKEAQTSENYTCPDCGEKKLTRIIETCRLQDGLVIPRLSHLKCRSCSARYFDDAAMGRIEKIRAIKSVHA